MLDRLRLRLTFHLERLVQRGALFQMLLMGGLIALVAIVGGLVARIVTPTFDGPLSAIWWAFLRLTDPGYLGDDQGVALRIISTVVTVLGYVLFMGSLIAIMTQWLARTIRGLESGLTPIVMKDHVVILGWTNRTPETVARLLRARGRLRRFLTQRRIGQLRVVILADEVDAARRLELREYLGSEWSESQVFLRSGSSLQPTHLARTDLARASVVLVPGSDFAQGGAELNDTRAIKTLLTIRTMLESAGERRPQTVAEIFDPRKVPLARSCVDGPLEVIASDQIISRLIYQSVLHYAVVQVLLDLFTHRQGNSIYLRGFPELAGASVWTLADTFPTAVVLGALRGAGAPRVVHLDPSEDLILEADDVLILLGETYDGCQPSGPAPDAGPRPAPEKTPAPIGDAAVHRILVLGWSHKLEPLVVELDTLGARRFEVTVVSKIPIAERLQAFAEQPRPTRVEVQHVEADYASAEAMRGIQPETFDSIVFLASGWMRSSEEADARTVLGYLLLESLLADVPDPPGMIVELLDPSNGSLLAGMCSAVLVSPRTLSHLLAHVALRPELNVVLDALLGAGGTELGARRVADFGLAGAEVDFADVQRAAATRRCVALGLITGATRAIELNPDRARRWSLEPNDQVIVLEPCDA